MDVAEFEELKRLPFIIDQLEAIQELHGRDTCGCCLHCLSDDGWSVKFPCSTRRLADDALGGDNNG